MTSDSAPPDAPIVIVEDDPGTAQIFGMELKDAGYQVQLLPDAESALAFFERAKAKAAIIDLHLSAIDGLELIERLRASADLASTPIALVTGDYLLDDAIVAQLTALHVRLYFKPIWSEDLRELARELLS